MSRKSQYKHVIKNLFPEAFTIENEPTQDTQVTYSIEDGMIQLQSLYHPEGVKITGKRVLAHMMRNINKYMDSTECKIYVLVFDKPNYVFKIKGIEQKKRARNNKTIPAPDYDGQEDLLPYDEPIPYKWDSMMANRSVRRQMIQHITNAIIKYYHPPAGKILIIDGGCIEGDTQPYAIKSKLPPDGKAYMNKDRGILTIDYSSDIASALTEREVWKPSNLRNKAGEGDICYLFYLDYFKSERIEHMTDKRITIDVLTKDTDFITLSLSYFTHLENLNMGLRLAMRSKKTGQESELWILHVDKLYQLVKNKLAQHMKYSSLSMAAAMITSGNDYVDGYGGIVPKRTLEIFINGASYIKDLVIVTEDKWLVDYKAYVRFIKLLYCDKFKTAIKKDLKAAKKKAKDEAMFENFLKEEVTWQEIRELSQKRNPKRDVMWVPDSKNIWLKYLRLCTNMEILRQGYKVDPTIIDDYSLEHGYELVDKSKPRSTSNIRLATRNDPQYKPDRAFLKLMHEEVLPSSVSDPDNNYSENPLFVPE